MRGDSENQIGFLLLSQRKKSRPTDGNDEAALGLCHPTSGPGGGNVKVSLVFLAFNRSVHPM
jgi:hypothetical protein